MFPADFEDTVTDIFAPAVFCNSAFEFEEEPNIKIANPITAKIKVPISNKNFLSIL